MNKKNAFLVFNGGSGNRGCEAIVRGTVKLLENTDTTLHLFSASVEQEKDVHLDSIIPCIPLQNQHNPLSRFIRHALCWLSFHKGDGLLQVRLIYENIWKHIKPNDLYLVIGGDVYCYGRPYLYYHINRILSRNKKVLWGCSIEPDTIDEEMITDLKSYDLIYARESITYNALIAAGITKNTVLIPDPAFSMPEIQLPLPAGFLEGNMVGVNVSPLIMQHNTEGQMVLDNYAAMIEDILAHTDYHIALIPHVIWGTSDDRIPLRILYDRFAHTGRIILLDGLSAQEIKGYISRCRFMVAARTHASIAAYSTCVPTLVVGYSVKARGIAADLFGTYENYVIPVQSLTKTDDLTRAFRWIMDHEHEIKSRLDMFMPTYCQKAKLATEAIHKLLADQ